MKWVALFSQTGSEILSLIKSGFVPDLIVTNSKNYLEELNDYNTVYVSNIDEEMYLKHLTDSTIVTLHGWLRIIPASICNKFRIFNGHPGLINMYPDLKGKDPQIRYFENIEKYEKFGSVIHEVVPEVDAGDIWLYASRDTIVDTNENKVFSDLADLSKYNWYNFLRFVFEEKYLFDEIDLDRIKSRISEISIHGC